MPPLAFRPALANSRYPSSRTDSFRTARETLYSSDEDETSTVRPRIPSANPSETEGMQIPRKEIGLGLGLESDNEGSTTPKAKNEISQPEFGAFDGEWGVLPEDISEVEKEWDDNLMRNVIVRKRDDRNMGFAEEGANTEVVTDDRILPIKVKNSVRELPSQENVGPQTLVKDSVEPNSKGGTWPRVRTDTADSPTMSDARRFSTVSGRSATSIVVEAFVVDVPPSRIRTLRHTKKQIGLRDFSSKSTLSSAPASDNSSEQRHRLVHKAERIPERRNEGLASNATPSITSSHKSRRKVIRDGGVPVVVIPDRMSSTNSSKNKSPSLRSTSSRKTKRSNSLQSAPLSQSSKTNEPGYFDIISATTKRTMSDSAGSSNSVRTIDYPPSIPTRRSSLSAPTSRNTSRANSLTAESLKAHNMLQERQDLKPEAVEAPKPVSSEKENELPNTSSGIDPNRLSIDHQDERHFQARRSSQVTPFSQASYETAGTAATTAEISQAMAVSMVSHRNKSWTVIHRESEPYPADLRRSIAQPTLEVNGETADGPVTPPQKLHPMDGVESPLRNPRAPPEPPAIKFIPPTPSDMSPGAAEERQLGFGFESRLDDEDYDDRPSTSERLKRNFSFRRAFNNRRYSDAPDAGLLKRTFSLSGRRKDDSTQTSKQDANPSTHYPSVLDQPADESKLHPFWRPANFWDDLEENDNESDDGEEDYFPEYSRPGNRRLLPKRGLSGKLKRTFAILPLSYSNDDHHQAPLDRKTMRRSPSGNALRVVKQRSNNTLRREADQRVLREARPGEFGHGFKEGNGGRIHTIPGLGVRIEYVGLRGLSKKLGERRKEQRNAKLRATISGPRGLRNGVDDVLESRNTQSRNVI